MTPASLLADLCQRGVRLRLSEDRLRILIAKDALTPELRDRLVALKPELIRLIDLGEQYRRLLREAFAADGSGDPGARRRQFGDEQARLVDDLGPALAGAIAEMEARAWRAATGSCPSCEGSGPCEHCAAGPEE